MAVVEDFKKWTLLEETPWRQKSREIWLKEGDRNIGYFHRMANSHRRRNDISRLKINRVWVIEKDEIRQGIVKAYKTLLSDLDEWRASLEGLDFSRLNEPKAARLEVPFSRRKWQQP